MIYYSLHDLHYVHKVGVGVGVPKVVVFRLKRLNGYDFITNDGERENPHALAVG